MRQASVLHSSSTSFSLLPSHPFNVEFLSLRHCRSSSTTHPWIKLPLNCSLFSRNTAFHLHSTAEVQAIVKTIPDESEFIEIGYVCNVHGLHGELRVKSSTDFPELRFTKPGTRWLRVPILGKEIIQEVELIEGRGHPGQKSWILSFKGIDTVDEARQIVGSTLLVREADRPILEEGEFYIPDLIGMRVVLKETGKLVGTVVNVFNSGASDLLQVMLNSTDRGLDHPGSSEKRSGDSGPLVWVPFVEEIVPDVDMNSREMHIIPPKGLLELNVRSDGRSKKERRQLEWKQRKKAQQRLISAKKKLNELGQHHLLQGFSSGDKAQKSQLAEQIMGINFRMFQQAIQDIDKPSHRYKLTDFINSNSTKLLNNALRISSEDNLEVHDVFNRGHLLMSEGKVAIILVNKNDLGSDYDFFGCGSIEHPSNALHLHDLLNDKKFCKMMGEQQISIPLIIVSAAQDIQSSQKLFLDHDYFGFNQKKVWFLEEEKLPVVSSSLTDGNRHKILLKSPWEILQAPVGSGGAISILSSHDVVENLTEMGVQYVEVCSLGQKSAVGHPSSLGFVESRDADIGIKMSDKKADDYHFDMIFSMRFLKKMTKQIDKLQFQPVLRRSSHNEKIDEGWVNVHPTSPNSYQLHSSIYSCLNVSSADHICLIQIAD